MQCESNADSQSGRYLIGPTEIAVISGKMCSNGKIPHPIRGWKCRTMEPYLSLIRTAVPTNRPYTSIMEGYFPLPVWLFVSKWKNRSRARMASWRQERLHGPFAERKA